MTFSLTLVIVAVTVLVSWRAFNDRALLERLILWPPAVERRRQYDRLLTHGFIHADWMHLLFNMLVLFMFGAPLEHVWGQKRFLVFYLACVVGAGLCQLAVGAWMVGEGQPAYPTVGASGGVLGLVLCGAAGLSAAQSIYTCIDNKGRRLTHDRPIAECADREQRELYSNGSVKRSIGPTLTEHEADLEAQRQRKEAEDRSRVTEARRRDRALLTRYQNVAAHDAERADALRQVDDVMAFGFKRLADLEQQRGGRELPSVIDEFLSTHAQHHLTQIVLRDGRDSVRYQDARQGFDPLLLAVDGAT